MSADFGCFAASRFCLASQRSKGLLWGPLVPLNQKPAESDPRGATFYGYGMSGREGQEKNNQVIPLTRCLASGMVLESGDVKQLAPKVPGCFMLLDTRELTAFGGQSPRPEGVVSVPVLTGLDQTVLDLPGLDLGSPVSPIKETDTLRLLFSGTLLTEQQKELLNRHIGLGPEGQEGQEDG